MDALEVLFNRRSIRKYKQQQVKEEDVKILLKAAMHAPTAGNQRLWHFLVTRETEKMKQVPVVLPYAQMIREAPMAIMICGDISMEKHPGYWAQDCAAAAQNILLAAHATNIGACWLGIFPVEERITGIKAIFNLPESIIPHCILPIGYPDEIVPPEDRWDESRIHINNW
jgi:nitroreductase